MTRVMVAVKTTEGGLWILPQVRTLRRRGAEVVVLLPPGSGRLATEVERLVAEDDGVSLLRSPFTFAFRPRRGLLRELVALRRLVRDAEVEVVLYHLYATALAIRLTTWRLPLRRVHMIAGPLYLESPVIAVVERLLWRLDSRILCGSRYTYARYRALGVPADRMTVVPYGVDLDHFRPPTSQERAAARRELALPATGLVVVMVSYVYAPKRLVHRGEAIKGHEVLLRAWESFHPRHPDATLLLVGGGFDPAGERHRQDILRRLGYRGGVRWVDSVADVRVAYRSADVSVSPSLSDNHGAVLEASAMGVPCLVSDAGALSEGIEPGVGWRHRAGSAPDLLVGLEQVARSAADGGLAQRGAAARRFVVAHFDQRRSTELVADELSGRGATAPGGRDSRPADGSAPRSVRIFSEVRLHRAPDGQVRAVDASSGAAAWDVYVERLGAAELAARVGPTEDSGVPVGAITVHPLPFYSGPRQLLRRLPRITLAVLAATADDSFCLFRLPGTLGLVGGAWCRLRRRPYAVEVVGDPASVLGSGVLGPVGRRLARAGSAAMRWVVAGAAGGRYVTERSLQRLYPLAAGVPEHHYSNVRLADEDFTPAPRPSRPVRRLLAVGSQDQLYKGHDDLIRAVALLGVRGVDVELGLVGDGRHHATLQELARSSGVADRVTFHGRVNDRAALRELLDQADLFCMPSRAEGLPRALIEAMARGLPAVGTEAGGIPELLAPAYRVPSSDPAALAEICERFHDGSLDAGRASVAGWSRAQEFRPDKQAERIDRWLAEVSQLARKQP